MRISTVITVLCLSALSLPAAAQERAPAAGPDLVIADVSVVDVERGEPVDHRTVAITGHRITAVTAYAASDDFGDALVIDGSGGYLIPGLWDMHVHTARAGRAPIFWPLFLANGVTGVREMGSYVDSLRHWRRVALREPDRAPRIVWGVMHGGDPPVYAYARRIGTPDAARDAVAGWDELGFDFIKVYDRIPREAYFALASEARERGVVFAGHVPEAVQAGEASDAGQYSIEHPRDLLIAAVPGAWELFQEAAAVRVAFGADSEEAREVLQRALGMLAFVAPDSAMLRPTLDKLVANGTWLTPTLTVVRGTLAPGALSTDPRLGYVPQALAEAWRTEPMLPPEQQETVGRRILEACIRVVALAHQADVGILAGTDASGVPYVFAGSGLHDELELLVGAGLTPAAALRAATINPARCLGMADSLGTVSVGKRADLVLLDANPLERIGSTRRVSAVVRAGRFLPRDELDRLREVAAAAAARTGDVAAADAGAAAGSDGADRKDDASETATTESHEGDRDE
jgi:hypothetical protein